MKNNFRAEILSNCVKENSLNFYKKDIVKKIAEILSGCYGPYGSHTLLKNGNFETHTYTKDGKTILDNIVLTGEISNFILSELRSITDHIANSVGDSTTSVVLLSNLILDRIVNNEYLSNYPPYDVISSISKVCNELIDIIRVNSQEFNYDRAYDIALISSNGNKEVADIIRNIYKEYGNDIYIEPKYSINGKEEIRSFDGTSLDYPMKKTLFINTNEGKCVVENAKIYYFKDPIDTRDMIDCVATIVNHNIMRKDGNKIGTVIIAPRYSRDFDIEFSSFFKTLENISNINRPPLCFIEADFDLSSLDDIRNLTNGIYISKYLTSDNKISYTNMEDLDKHAGFCKKVIIDGSKTIFEDLYNSDRFNIVIDDLKCKIINEEKKSNPNESKIHNYKKRINKLKSRIVEIYVNSLSTSDKCNKYLILEDVCTSVMNASKNGVGRACTFELLMSTNKIDSSEYNNIDKAILDIIKDSSKSLVRYLISTCKVYSDKEIDKIIEISIQKELPFNILTKDYDDSLITTIMSDIEILNSISVILSKLIMTNQMLISSDVEAMTYNNTFN